MSTQDTTRKLALVALATLVVLAGGLVQAVSPGLAFGGYRTLPSVVFGGAGSGDGQFEEPGGVAVDDSSGDFYVADRGNNRVQKFDSSGGYLSQFAGGETPAGSFSEPYSLAVDNSCALQKLTGSQCAAFDPSDGDVYVADVGHSVIDIFDSSGKYVSQISGTASPFASELLGVAVDTEGNLWVVVGPEVDVFSNTGKVLESFFAESTRQDGIAVDANDDVYLLEGNAFIKEVNSAGVRLSQGWDFGRAVAVNESTNNVLLDKRDGIREFGPFAQPYGVIVQEFGSGGEGIAVNDLTGTAYSARAEAEPSVHGEADTVSIFPEAVLAKVLGTRVTDSQRTTAQVLAQVAPEGSAMKFRVVYGETDSYGEHSEELEAAASNAEATIQLGLQGLAPGRTYHYAMQVTNSSGTTTSPDSTFTTSAETPPTVTTGSASSVGLTAAMVSGMVDAQGLETSYEFDFGTDTAYGTSVYGEAGSAAEPIELSVALQSLAPGTTYHYRIVAVNSDGKTYGSDEVFATPAYSAPIVLPAALPLIGTPGIVFPVDTGTTTGSAASKSLTRAQKLARALKACKREKKSKRATCEKQAHKRYGAAKKAKKA
jgi:hypothetical protein